MSQVRVSLAGVPLALRPGDTIAWSLTCGVHPFQSEFVLDRGQAEKILAAAGARGGPVALEFWHGEEHVKIEDLWILRSGPGDDPVNTLALLVSDNRWKWAGFAIVRTYNERRRSGEVRYVDGEVTPLQVRRRVPDVDYRRATLKDNGNDMWTPAAALEDVLGDVVGGDFAGFAWGALPTPALQDPLQDVFLRDQAPEALQRLLGAMPGTDLAPTLDGGVTTVNELDGSEVRAAESAGKILAGSGSWGVPDTGALIPNEVSVLVEQASEIRFDYEEGLASTPRESAGRENPILQNVAPVTDATLAVDGVTASAGEYRTIGQLLDAYEELADYPISVGVLDRTRLLRWTLSGMAGLLRIYVSGDPPGATDLKWARRLMALQDHFRRTFRILPQWRDKIGSLKASRVALVDAETGTLQRAPVYFDHVIRPTFLGLARADKQALGWSVTSWAADLANATVAPAEVEIVDEDLGIFRVEARPDLLGFGADIAMGTMSQIPDASAGSTYCLWNQVSLDNSWKLSVVLTVTQAVPCNRQRMRAEVVKLEEALKLLPASAIPPVKGRGEYVEVLCGDVTARYAWLDAERDAILNAFWSGSPPPEKLLTNYEEVRDAAVAQAARVIAPLLPRGRGRFKVSLNGKVVPTGNLKTVTHGVTWGGPGRDAVAWTELDMPGSTVSPSLLSLMPERTRRVLARLATVE